MKKINKLLIALTFSSLLFGQAIQEEPPQVYPTQEKVRIQESLEYSALLNRFLTQPEATDFYALASALKKDDKPIPALAIVNLGLKLHPDSGEQSQALTTLKKEITDRISYLKSRYHSFKKESDEKGTLEAFGSMAAIKYHLGFIREAVSILDHAMGLKGNYTELNGLKQSFYSEMQLNSRAFLIVDKEFQDACGQADFEKALTLASQLCYMGIYAENTLETLDILEQTFPGKCNPNSLTAIKGMPNFILGHAIKGSQAK